MSLGASRISRIPVLAESLCKGHSLLSHLMKTKVYRIDPSRAISEDLLTPAISLLKASKVVAIPTETVYGLAANAFDPIACSQIFEAKSRPRDNPLIVHVSSMAMLKSCVREGYEIPPSLVPVLDKFWPGPLTVLLPKSQKMPDEVTCGLETVAIRMPSHPAAKRLIELCGFPLAAPSANKSGRPSPTRAEHVLEDLEGAIEAVVDAGPSSFGVESTVIDVLQSPPMILRPGSITLEMLRPFLPDLAVFERTEGAAADEHDFRPSTPGMKYRHYSPTAPVILFDVLDLEDCEERIAEFVLESLSNGGKVVRLLNSLRSERLTHPRYHELVLSEANAAEEIAANLFDSLRRADQLVPDVIIAQSVSEDNEGLAIMNRLGKASSTVIRN